jgi:fructose-1,6-bisphosphatase/inositol monophosphatase family enzyme
LDLASPLWDEWGAKLEPYTDKPSVRHDPQSAPKHPRPRRREHNITRIKPPDDSIFGDRDPFKIQPMASIAYKLARVSAGLADIPFTLLPKHESDIAAGTALIAGADGFVQTPTSPFLCNREDRSVDGFVASGDLLKNDLLQFWAPHLQLVDTNKMPSGEY